MNEIPNVPSKSNYDTQERRLGALDRLLEYEKFSKMCIAVAVLSPMSNGDWKALLKQDRGLVEFIDRAIQSAKAD